MRKTKVEIVRGDATTFSDREVLIKFEVADFARGFEVWWGKVGDFLFHNWCDHNGISE